MRQGLKRVIVEVSEMKLFAYRIDRTLVCFDLCVEQELAR